MQGDILYLVLIVCTGSANQITAFALNNSVRVAQPIRLQYLHCYTSRILLMADSV